MAEVEAVIQALVAARRTHRRVPALVPADTAAACAVQQGVARALGWFGDTPARHWKSGGASRSAPQTHAPLPPQGIWHSPADARPWPLKLRGIEAEVALRLGCAVDAAQAATLDRDAAVPLVDAMCVAIELVDSRWSEALDAPALSRLADLQSHAALVLGDWRPFEASRDWAAQTCTVRVGTRAPHSFRGSHSLGDPLWVLPAWLRDVTRDGTVLAAGTVVTTGTWCGLLLAEPGERVDVSFDGLGEACVQF